MSDHVADSRTTLANGLQLASDALMNGELDDAREQVNRLRMRSDLLRDTDATTRVAELCLLAGMVDEADALIAAALQERGDHAEFHAYRERIRALTADDVSDREVAVGRSEHGVEVMEGLPALLEAARADTARFMHLFAGREDYHARQWRDGSEEGRSGYSPLRAPLTPEVIAAHLGGSITVGVYLLRLDQTAMFFCLDIDIRRKALEQASTPAELHELRRLVHDATMEMQARLTQAGLPLLMEDSGYKGRHLWGFLKEPVPGAMLHRFGRTLRAFVGNLDPRLSLEFFPKQESVAAGGLGNLVKLPLGVHLVSGRRSTLMQDGNVVANPWPVLHGIRRFSRSELMDIQTHIRATTGGHTHVVSTGPRRAEPDSSGAKSHPGGSDLGQGEARPLRLEDLKADPNFTAQLQGCPVLASLVEQATVQRRLSHHERVVIIHSLGHLAGGVDAVNAILAMCPDTPRQDRLQRMLRGHPISCGRIRERIPETTSRLPCACEFAPSDVLYPTPSRHLLGSPLLEERTRSARAAEPRSTEPRPTDPRDLGPRDTGRRDTGPRDTGEEQFADTLEYSPVAPQESAAAGTVTGNRLKGSS
jgi:hypothetical protein